MISTEPEGRPAAQAGNDEIDLGELFRTMWAGRWTIMLVSAAFLALAAVYLHRTTYLYTAELTLTPAQAGASSKLGGLGGLASLAGINLPQGQGDLSFSMYVEGVHSRGLADALLPHQDILRVLFPAEWNAQAGRWEQPSGFVPSAIRTVKNVLGAPVSDWRPPEGARLREFLDSQVAVTMGTDNPFVTLSFKHQDPAFAVHFLNTLNLELDNILRQKALVRSTSNIAYLSEQLGKVTISEHRAAIAESLSEQEKQRMAASSSAPFAADPFGSASASSRPTTPRPPLILAVSVIGGGICGTLLVLLLSYRSSLRARSRENEGGSL